MTRHIKQPLAATTDPVAPTRRELIVAMAIGAFGVAGDAAAQTKQSATDGAAKLAPPDWDFLVGRWTVHNRRLKQRLVGSTQWDEFGSTLVNWPVLGGQGNVGDNVFEQPGGSSYRGVSVRAFDPETRQWLSWWLDARTPTLVASPVRGGFKNGVGTLVGDDMHQGKPVKVRILWSRITANSARWEQASSADGGANWETNWTSDFTRA